ncbi:MAG: peptidoglycan-binding protein [Negativicutes bacterium]|nr:peptidoglycan-binding protein [Negativicutes bacterium]
MAETGNWMPGRSRTPLLLSIMVGLTLFCMSAGLTAENGDRDSKRDDNSGRQIVEAQQLLAQHGFYADDIDGIWGRQSESALISFQVWCGIYPSGVLDPATWERLRRPVAPPGEYRRKFVMRASAYSPEETSGITARGHRVRKGLVSVDPSHIPLGSRLYITGYGYAVADDVGGAMSPSLIDLGFDSLTEALAFGCRDVEVYLL